MSEIILSLSILKWRSIIRLKLISSSVSGKLFTLIRNIYNDIKSCVCLWNGQMEFLADNGVQRELFALFLNDVKTTLLCIIVVTVLILVYLYVFSWRHSILCQKCSPKICNFAWIYLIITVIHGNLTSICGKLKFFLKYICSYFTKRNIGINDDICDCYTYLGIKLIEIESLTKPYYLWYKRTWTKSYVLFAIQG